ncbi:MAG: LptF/LptG family permease [candidate division WOR-3 bacterium]
MRILERETLRQFIPAFFFAIVILAFILLMDRLFLLADLLVRKGVPVKVVGEIALLSLPFVISISAPLGGLIGGVVTFGRMAQDNEVAAVRAAGIPAWRLFVPALLFGVILVPLMGAFNGFLLPESQHRVRSLLTDVARKRPALRLQERVFLDDFPGYMVYLGAMDERRSTVTNVVIFEQARGKRVPSFVTAPRGRIEYTPDGRYMILTLYDGEIHELVSNDNYRRLSFKEHIINVLADWELVRREREYRSEDEMLFSQLLSRVSEIKRDIDGLKLQLRAVDSERRPVEEREFRKDEIRTRLRYRNLEMVRFLTELQKRFSLAFSCLLFLFFGVPVGLLLRRGGIGTGFIVGLIFFAFYYVMLVGGEHFAENGRVTPFLGMWLPNLILVIPVVELMARAFFEFSFLDFILKKLKFLE